MAGTVFEHTVRLKVRLLVHAYGVGRANVLLFERWGLGSRRRAAA
jgi:hypothetical protein